MRASSKQLAQFSCLLLTIPSLIAGGQQPRPNPANPQGSIPGLEASTYDTPPVLLSSNSDSDPTVRQEIVPLGAKPQQSTRSGSVVILSVTIDSSGKETRAAVDESTDITMEQKALTLVRQDRFRPALKLGRPVEATVRIRVTFTVGAN